MQPQQKPSMDIDIGTVPVNLPYKYCPSIKNREIFNDYGSNGIIDIDRDGEIVCQRKNEYNCVKYAAIHPVLPLSCTAQRVCLPLVDRVMGKIIEQNKQLKSFYGRIKKCRSLGKRWGKDTELEDILLGLDDYKLQFTPDNIESYSSTPEFMKSVDSSKLDAAMTPWFRNLLKEYTELKDVTAPQFNNYKYVGGCISCIPVDDAHYCRYIVSAAGQKFDTICMSRVVQTVEGLLQCYKVEEISLPDTIYGIKSGRVQGQDFVSVRTDKHCYLYYFALESGDSKLQFIQKSDKQCFPCIDISPYIPGECVLVDTDGKCLVWCADSLKSCVASCERRFQVSDEWRHIQYGSHPRQLVYADQTSVQLFDLRTSNAEGHDLFSLPSPLLHNRERVRMCARHPASTFYHLVATDYTLMIMDERYSKYPVLKWDHMLSTPPQYMSSLQGSECSADDNLIYIASQFPADVHAFRFSMKEGLPPVSTCLPHRAAKIMDMSLWSQFVDKCPNTDVLRNRLQTSLAGISTSPWQQGHVVFQLDSHGDIFHQVFSTNCSSADITFSEGLGSHDLHPLPAAVDRAQSWIKSWVDIIKEQLQEQIKTRDIRADLWGRYLYRNPHKSCCVCRPDLNFVPGGIDVPNSTDLCETCMVQLQNGQNLVSCTQKDRIMPSTSTDRPRNLKEVNDVSTDTALSKLLMKHWYGDKHDQEFDDILKEWDKEVIEKRKAMKDKPKSVKPDMSEESVMRRILSKPAGQAGSSPAHTNSSASWEPSIESRVDDIEHGQVSRKHRPRNTEEHGDKRSVASSVKMGLRRKIKENELRRDKRGAVNSDRASTDNHVESVVSEDDQSVKSVVYGYVDDIEHGQVSRKHRPRNIEDDDKRSVASSVKRGLRRKVKENGLRRDKRGAVNTDRASTDNHVESVVSEDDQSVVYGSVDSFESRTFQRVNTEKEASLQAFTSMLSQTIQPDKSKPDTCNASISLFSSPTSQINNETNNGDLGLFKVPSSGKINIKKKKYHSPSSVSEFSVATSSEDLFHDISPTLELASEEDDRLSSVFSIASCPGLLSSQVSSHVARNLFSSQQPDTQRIDQLTSSPKHGGVGNSRRTPAKRKLLAGF